MTGASASSSSARLPACRCVGHVTYLCHAELALIHAPFVTGEIGHAYGCGGKRKQTEGQHSNHTNLKLSTPHPQCYLQATEQAVNVFEREYVERENSLKEALKAFRVVDADNSGIIARTPLHPTPSMRNPAAMHVLLDSIDEYLALYACLVCLARIVCRWCRPLCRLHRREGGVHESQDTRPAGTACLHMHARGYLHASSCLPSVRASFVSAQRGHPHMS
jgi:hypothetical protein